MNIYNKIFVTDVIISLYILKCYLPEILYNNPEEKIDIKTERAVFNIPNSPGTLTISPNGFYVEVRT